MPSFTFATSASIFVFCSAVRLSLANDAVSIFSEKIQVLSHGGVACRASVEIRGHDSARREASVHAAGEPGQSFRGCRGEEHGLRRL